MNKSVIESTQVSDKKQLQEFQSELQTKECNLCHYAPSLRKQFLFPVASNGAGRVLVVGVQSFMEEHKNSIACSGAFRSIFCSYLKKFVGLSETDCTFTYAVKCTENDAIKPKTLEFKNCSRYLLKDIKLVDPAVIIFLGKDASKSLIDNRTRQKYGMGIPFQYRILAKNRWCYFMLNPIMSKTQTAAVSIIESHFKGLNRFFSDHTNLYDTVIRPKIETFVAITDRKYILVDTEEALQEMKVSLNGVQYLGADTETNSLYTWKDDFKVVGISLAADETTGYYIPFGHKSYRNIQYNQLSWDTVKPVINEILSNIKTQVIWHNLYYDYAALQRMGLNIFKLNPDKNIWTHDSMLMAYLHNENSRIGLKPQMYLHFNISPKQFKGVLEDSDVNTFEEIAPKDALQYAADDAINCLMLFKKLEPLVKDESVRYTDNKLMNEIYPSELRTIKVLADAHLKGIRIDEEYLSALSETVTEDMKTVKDKIFAISTAVTNISSNPKIVEFLDNILSVRFKERFLAKFDSLNAQEKTLRTIATGYEKYWSLAQNKIVDTLLNSPYEYPGKWQPAKLKDYLNLLVRYRHLLKMKRTYIDAIEELAQPEEGIRVIHANIKSIGTTSGRMSSNNPNLQNIPRSIPKVPIKCDACSTIFRDDSGEKADAFKADITLSSYICTRCAHVNKTWTYDLRRLYIPRKGYKFIAADYVGMELYLAAAVSGCKELYDVFLKKEINNLDPNGDMHVVTASSILGITPDTWKKWSLTGTVVQKKKAKETRTIAKTVNYLTLYGGSAEGLYKSLLAAGVDKSVEQCEGYITAFFNAFPALKKWFDTQKYTIQNTGRLVNNAGRIRHILKRGGESLSAINMLIQGLGAQIIKESLINLYKQFMHTETNVLLTIHDENILEVQDNLVKDTSKIMKEIMEVTVVDALTVDLKIDIISGMKSLSKADKGEDF